MRLLASTAQELMTAGPVSVSADASAEQVTAFLADRGFGAAVAIDDAGHPVGVVTKTDVLVHARERAAAGRTEPATVRDIMTPAVFSVREDAPAESVVRQLLALNVRHLFVVDAGGVPVGIISPTDVLRHLG